MRMRVRKWACACAYAENFQECVSAMRARVTWIWDPGMGAGPGSTCARDRDRSKIREKNALVHGIETIDIA